MKHGRNSNAIQYNLWLVSLLLVCVCGVSVGCSRSFWRQQADKDSYYMIRKKIQDPRWNLPRIDIEPDSRSRFAHPYDQAEPPLPPDDPAANRYMHRVAGMKGFNGWHKFGRALAIENPHWLEPYGIRIKPGDYNDCNLIRPLPTLENLTLVEAIELSYIHSREYQTQIEDLYLAALDLTFERFQFMVRYLGFGGEPSADLDFESIPDGQNSLTLNQRFGISQLLPTGGQWVIELANNTIWLFTGPNESSTASVLSYSLVQPLLRGAGRDVVLENLTQTERDVLYTARDLARFRKDFFTGVVSSFLGLLQQSQRVTNQQGNIVQLEQQLALLRALASQRPQEIPEPLESLPPGLEFPDILADQLRYEPEDQVLIWSGPMSDEQARALAELSDDPAFRATANELIQRLSLETVTLDVAQLQTQLAQSLNNLRNAERALQDLLDQFKITLGLPPDMPVSINESVLEQFVLIDPVLSGVTEQVEEFVEVWAQLNVANPDSARLRQVASQLQELADQVRSEGLNLVQQDIDGVGEAIQSENFADRPREVQERVRRDVERDRRLYDNIVRDFEQLVERVGRLQETLSRDDIGQESRSTAAREIADIREALLKVAQSLQVIQINQRVELITLQPFTIELEQAVGTALANRLDLMNVRGQVMDARRRVEVVANGLESVVDIRAEGDIRTPAGDNPFDFRGDLSSYRVGVALTAPLDQINERNDFRAALIGYQRARRDYIAFEDQVKFDVRQSWRQLNVLQQNFEITRQQIRIAASQLDLAVEEATAPLAPGQTQGAGAQGLNFLNALQDVLNAQNSLIGIWVDYERNRLNIYRDMGIMEIDPSGIWYDEFYQQQVREQRSRHGTNLFGTGPGSFPDDDGRDVDFAESDAGAGMGEQPRNAGSELARPPSGILTPEDAGAKARASNRASGRRWRRRVSVDVRRADERQP